MERENHGGTMAQWHNCSSDRMINYPFITVFLDQIYQIWPLELQIMCRPVKIILAQ
jgi:hypothetical protein